MANKNQMPFDADQVAMITRIVRNECKDLADAVDETSISNLKRIGQVTDRNSYNILKLQAQITALKEVLIAKGSVARGVLSAREKSELTRLENQVKALENPEAAAGAMPQ